VFCTTNDWTIAFPTNKENDAHESLSLILQREDAPNAMVMDGAKAHEAQSKFICKLHETG
jgi:hypothetical protein